MKVWLICPKCLDAFQGTPGKRCLTCGGRSVVAPLNMQYKSLEMWDEICLDGADVIEIKKYKSKNYNCTVFVNCDGETHFAVDRDDELLFAVSCDC